MLTIPLWNIRNKLCEATTKFSWARNFEERHEFWCRNWDQGFQNRKTSSLKFPSVLDVSNVIFRKTP